MDTGDAEGKLSSTFKSVPLLEFAADCRTGAEDEGVAEGVAAALEAAEALDAAWSTAVLTVALGDAARLSDGASLGCGATDSLTDAVAVAVDDGWTPGDGEGESEFQLGLHTPWPASPRRGSPSCSDASATEMEKPQQQHQQHHIEATLQHTQHAPLA